VGSRPLFTRHSFYYGLALVVFLLDQATKWAISSRLPLYAERPVIDDFFSITHFRNAGAAFGILQNQRAFFLIVTVVVATGVIWYLDKAVRRGRRMLAAALAMLLGGAVGNFVDRALYGEVVDFLQFRFRFEWFGTPVDYTYPVFNLADSAIVVGVGLILLDSLLDRRRETPGGRASPNGEGSAV